MWNGEGKLFTAKVRNAEQLEEAIAQANSESHRDSLCFLEIFLDKDDCSKE